MKNNSYCLILTTTNELEVAQNIAQHLIKEKLAACVQMDLVTSYYNWENKLQQDEEYRLMIKTLSNNYVAIEEAILKMHNYSVPQIIKLDIAQGFNQYLNWLDSSC